MYAKVRVCNIFSLMSERIPDKYSVPLSSTQDVKLLNTLYVFFHTYKDCSCNRLINVQGNDYYSLKVKTSSF